MKDWKDELKKQAEGFYIGLGDLQSETGFMDGVNYAIDKSKPIIESLLKKQREICAVTAEREEPELMHETFMKIKNAPEPGGSDELER